jgi:hypothetical protein
METPENIISAAKVRKLTVCNKVFPREATKENSHRGNVVFPIISLSGKWLLDSGFEAGHVVDITCEDRKLIITISKEQRFEWFE